MGPLFQLNTERQLKVTERSREGSPLKQQLELLLELQARDATVRELEAEMAKLPAALDTSRRDLARLESMVAGERAKLAETLAWQNDQKATLEREQESLKTAKIRVQQVKNNKEFAAASREVEHKRKAISDREAELRKVGDAMTTSTASSEAHAKDVDQLRQHLAGQEQEVEARLSELRARLDDAVAARDSIRVQVDGQLVKTYDTLASKRGFAVAAVRKGVCQGCHMGLPPQLNNILARMQTIESCPRCGRIVYREEMLTEGKESATE